MQSEKGEAKTTARRSESSHVCFGYHHDVLFIESFMQLVMAVFFPGEGCRCHQMKCCIGSV